MKQKLPQIAAIILGLLFLVFGLNFFLKFIPIPSPPEGTPAANFMGAIYSTGFLTFVKVLEILGGILVLSPVTRRIGLCILVPIIVNILAVHIFLMGGAGLFDPPVILITLLGAYLVVVEHKAFCPICRRKELAATEGA